MFFVLFCFLTKKPGIHTIKLISSTKESNQTGRLHVEESKQIHTYHPVKTQLQMDWGPQYKARYTEPVRKESGKGDENLLHGTEHHRSKKQPTEWEKICINYTSNRGLIFKRDKTGETRYQEANNLSTKWGAYLNRILNIGNANGWEIPSFRKNTFKKKKILQYP